MYKNKLIFFVLIIKMPNNFKDLSFFVQVISFANKDNVALPWDLRDCFFNFTTTIRKKYRFHFIAQRLVGNRIS